MKILFFILFFLMTSFAHAQEWFLGKTENAIRDSLFKISYYSFFGTGFPDKRYEMQFGYLDYSFLKDTVQTRDTGVIVKMDTIHLNTYHFLFSNDICISSTEYFNKFKEYPKMLTYLDSQYKRAVNGKIGEMKWVDETDGIEAILRKDNNGFWVRFKKISN